MSPGVKTIILTLLALSIGATVVSYYRYIVVGDVPFITEGFTLEEEE
ncbi:MAG TPA: hypothetical protein VEB18_03785 [Candidatus Paceibacterota bacterium]|nr:hypothetical protein [Candidatus Paceibacterota bacterium]